MSLNPPPFLQLRNAVVRRAGRAILTVDAFELACGENIALLGPNGKSTFVKLVTREMLPLHRDEPPVFFKGRDRATLAEVKRSLGVVSSTMQEQMTVHLPVVDIVAGGLFGALGIPQAVLRGMKGFIDLGEGLGVPRLGFGMIHVGSTTPFVV